MQEKLLSLQRWSGYCIRFTYNVPVRCGAMDRFIRSYELKKVSSCSD